MLAAVTSARARPRAARAGTGLVPPPVRIRRVSLAWPRLPAAAEVAIVVAGYFGYALVRLAVRASRPVAIAHATLLWRSEQWLHLDIEPSVNHLAAARPVLAELAGYYYGLAHFIVTPLVLAWLWLRRPAAFGPLRSALVLATTGANVVFWTWPVAPPRFAVPGMTDVLVRYRILGAGSPHGPDSLINLYAAMPSLHVAWAVWCTAAIVTATRSRWRHLAWLYPAATTVVVLATANHFLAAAAAGLAITALGLLAARARTRPDATEPAAGHPDGADPERTGRDRGSDDRSDPGGPSLRWHKSSPWNREDAGATQARLGMTGQARAFIAALGDEQASSGEIRNARAVICLAEGDPAGALAEAAGAADGTAPVTGDVTVMEAHLLAGLAHRQLGDLRAANQAAERALALAEPDRLVLPFAMTGSRELLEALPRHETAHAALLAGILEVLHGGSPAAADRSRLPPAEELSLAELRVLRYLPMNLSRPEIARELSVSPNTVNAHVRSIYAKLAVGDRSAAVQRARELRLLATGSPR